MWNKFKRHFSHLFHPDQDQGTDEENDVIHRDEAQENKKRQPYRKIDTKMTYYYPKEREFKFPVSIDEVGKNRGPHQKEATIDKKEVQKQPKETSNAHKPFKVTEIPSPVYGFKKRLQEKKETSETTRIVRQSSDTNPSAYVSNILNEVRRIRGEMSDYAYDRIGQKRQSTVEPPNPNDKARELDATKSFVEKSEKLMIADDNGFKDEKLEESYNTVRTNDRNTSQEVNEEPVLIEQPILSATQSPSITQEDTNSHNQETLLKRSPVHEPAKREFNKSQTPFNVRMRPSDKKRYYDRLKEQQSKREAQTKNQIQSKSVTLSEDVKQNPLRSVEPISTSMDDSTTCRDKSVTNTLPLYLLNDPVISANEDDTFIRQQSNRLIEALRQFNVQAEVVNVMQGPSVTRFEIKPETGVKVSKVKNLSDDLKLSLAAKDIRIEAPIPGKHAIGIEVPNETTRPVMLSEILTSTTFQQAASPLTVGLGLDISGEAIVTDLQKMPHGLIAGATGSGKSVCINTILLSLLYKASPEEVRLLLIDPKMVELQPYNALPHLVSPVITDVKAATQALKWAVEEMERRYQQFVENGARDLSRYNEKMRQSGQETLPMIVIVIDELADLMMAAPQDVEDAICRIAQKARAAGIHLLLATQRPSVDVVTGLIKSNIPSRIAFSVASQVDSRTMIDTAGAERLLGRGDLLFVENGARHPVRIQGAFVSDDEIERVTRYLKQQSEPNYLFEQEDLLQSLEQEEMTDELYDEALDFVSENETISTSLLQRRFKIGYNRAARIIDTLEHQGIVSGQNGSKPRTILISKEELNQLRQSEL